MSVRVHVHPQTVFSKPTNHDERVCAYLPGYLLSRCHTVMMLAAESAACMPQHPAPAHPAAESYAWEVVDLDEDLETMLVPVEVYDVDNPELDEVESMAVEATVDVDSGLDDDL